MNNKVTGKQFALKFFTPKNKNQKTSIKNEIGLMQMCSESENIIRCYEAFKYNKKIWVLLELMEGGCLSDYITSGNQYMTENICAYILCNTLRGLTILHSRNIMHRDIKSDNILVNFDGAIKLSDFGYAAQLTNEQRRRKT